MYKAPEQPNYILHFCKCWHPEGKYMSIEDAKACDELYQLFGCQCAISVNCYDD